MLRIKTILLFSLLLNSSILVAQVKFMANYIETPLNEALDEFSERYHVNFGYDPALLDSIFVTVKISSDNEQSAITSILKGTGFESKKIKDIYLIQPKKSKEKVIIHGYVQDRETNERLPYAFLYNAKNKIGTTSSPNGFFSIETYKNDTLKIVCSYIGYKNRTINIDLSEITKPIIIELIKETKLINEIIVKSNNSISGINACQDDYSINTMKMQNLPNPGENDVFYTMKYIPGVSATNESSSGIEIRGCPPEQNLVLFDGMSLYHLDHFFGTFSALNSMVVKNVQLYKSSYPAKYGGRIAGVVDIIGKTGNSDKMSMEANINMLSSSFCFETPIFNKATLFIAARRSYTDFLKSTFHKRISGNNINGSKESTYSFGGDIRSISNEAIPDFYYYDINAKLSWMPSDKDRISLSFYQGFDHYSVHNIDSVAFYSIKTYNKTNWGNQAVNIEWNKQWSNTFISQLNCAFSGFNSRFERQGVFQFESLKADTVDTRNENKIGDTTIKLSNEVNLSNKHSLNFGIDYSFKEVVYKRFNDNMFVESKDGSSNELAFYIQDRCKISEAIILDAGVRFNYYNKTNSFTAEPRMGFKYYMFDCLYLKSAVSMHNQYISKIVSKDDSGNHKDFWILSDNVGIPSLKSNHYTSGFVFTSNDFTIDVEFYKMDFWGITANQIPALNLNYNPSVYYTGSGYSKGIDVFIQRTGDLLNTTLSYSFGKSIQRFDKIEQGKEFPSVHDQLHEFKFIQSYKCKKWDFVLTCIYGSGKPYTKPYGVYSINLLDGSKLYENNVSSKNNYRLPDYHRMDFAVNYNWQLKKINTRIGLSFINIFNSKNIRSINYFVNNEVIEGEKKAVVIENVVKSIGFTPNLSLNVIF